MTNFIIEPNLPVSVDHKTELIKTMCYDSKIAREYQCKITKTIDVVNTMASDIIRNMHSSIEMNPLPSHLLEVKTNHSYTPF